MICVACDFTIWIDCECCYCGFELAWFVVMCEFDLTADYLLFVQFVLWFGLLFATFVCLLLVDFLVAGLVLFAYFALFMLLFTLVGLVDCVCCFYLIVCCFNVRDYGDYDCFC